MRFLPILFNTEMVRAILDDRKKATRRIVPLDIVNRCDIESDGKTLLAYENDCGDFIEPVKLCRYQPGDILYVRETWYKDAGRYLYRADYSDTEKFYMDGQEIKLRWRPSIHMPKEAARIWLRVTNVRVERLCDIDEAGAIAEGLYEGWRYHGKGSCALSARQAFSWLWQFITLDAPAWQSWALNPWVFVVAFERCEKPEAVA